jgi:hypothetical protein
MVVVAMKDRRITDLLLRPPALTAGFAYRQGWQEMHQKVTTENRHHSGLSRVRIKVIPALRYEGFDLSRYEIGKTYHVERRLAELLIQRGFAELEVPRSRNSKVERDSAF